MRLIHAFAAALLLLAPLQAAAQAADPSRSAAEQLTRRLFAAMNVQVQVDSMVAAMVPEMIKRNAPQLSVDDRLALAEVMEASIKEVSPRMIESMVSIYVENFTEAELSAAVGYFESPEGRSYMAKSIVVMPQAMQATQRLVPELEEAFRKRICEKVSCTPGNLRRGLS